MLDVMIGLCVSEVEAQAIYRGKSLCEECLVVSIGPLGGPWFETFSQQGPYWKKTKLR
jgi:hypothetical protein